MSKKQTTTLALLILIGGFMGGLVVSGRLGFTTPSVASPEQSTPRPAVAVSPTGAALPDLSTVAESALKVSANISSTTLERVQQDPFWQFFYGQGDQVQQSQSLGSGVVVSPDGYVLTNKHVIGNARAEVRVTLQDGRERAATLIGIDDVSDLAVVKVDAQGLSTLPWGDSSKLRVAEWVLAIGNPFQFTGTVTLGIISTVSRSGEQVGSSQDFIQTDAAINPGNSGGALVNARGELVGINNRIISETGGFNGIGLAIPSNLARRIMNELIKNGRVTWGSIGEIDWFSIDRSVAGRYGLNVTGALVNRMQRASSAYRAGLRPGDLVTEINSETVTSADQINRVVVGQPIGRSVKLTVLRSNGRSVDPANSRTLTIDVPIVARE